ERFFWDSIHPSTATHKLIGNFALNALESHFQTTSSVPEPKSLLALGLIVIASCWSLRNKIK
ncbi:MAG: PEP-CTERM sorting domain-containing protein, partial [Xenococcaceae cyanobacterium MO_188.B19]|nr:PEP-CTERM sorting domain-containing protein [Xenococcaceae cyanobacterium MO_188.B19]